MFLWTLNGLITSGYFLKFFSNHHACAKVLVLMVLELLAKTFASKKIEFFNFYSSPKKNSPQVLIIIPEAEGHYPLLLKSVFLKSMFSPAHREGGLWSRKIDQN